MILFKIIYSLRLNYFGYMLEPFSMKEEREIGNITKEGFYAINKQKEK